VAGGFQGFQNRAPPGLARQPAVRAARPRGEPNRTCGGRVRRVRSVLSPVRL